MQCKDCENRYWFGDYALDYCRIDKEIVTEESYCHIKNESEKENESRIN